jgi:hypothetical protein
MKRSVRIWIVAGLALLLAIPAGAAERSIEAFYGEFVGRAVSGEGAGVEERDINVTIKPDKRGFTVSWSTVSHRAGGESKRKSYTIEFRRSNRDGIFQSAMRKDVFGQESPNDPMKGDPYVWARIVGDTLSIYAMIVTDDGSYDMQAYHRTLTDDGMKLRFSRTVEGEPKKVITGDLKRVVQ